MTEMPPWNEIKCNVSFDRLQHKAGRFINFCNFPWCFMSIWVTFSSRNRSSNQEERRNARALLAEIETWSSHSTEHLSDHTWLLRPVLVPTIQEKCRQTGEGPKETMRMINGEPVLWRKTEGDGYPLPGEEKAQEDLIIVFQYLKGGFKEEEGSLITRTYTEKTRGNGYKLH